MRPAPVRNAGYTIIETMIFLVISAVLLLSAIGLFSGRIQRTQFNQSVQALATKISTVANEVTTGTYPTTPAFDCSVSAGVPQVTPLANSSTDLQGTREDCIFVGKVMNFSVTGSNCTAPINQSDCENIEVYSVLGRRESNQTKNLSVTSLTGSEGARPRIVSTPNITTSFNLGYGTHVTGVFLIEDNNSLTPISGLGLFQTFGGSYDATDNLTSGSQNVNFWAIKKSDPVNPTNIQQMAEAVEDETPLIGPNPNKGVLLCLRDSGDNRRASITIFTANGATRSVVAVEDTRC
ncbi:MAG: hypothetical protein QG553_628 [Patescibacteria group bacterium]|nr:hypothetical protein [Patescibacteria group bacterium]